MAAARAEAEALSRALRDLPRPSGQTTASLFEGAHSQRRSGVGETFWQFRPYQPGESAGAIDWRQSARARHHLVREHEWQAARTYWFWLDASASMRFSGDAARPTKLGRGLALLLTLAMMAVDQGERVGLLGRQDRPGFGRQGIERLCLGLEGLDDAALPDADRLRLQPFSRVVLFSDFLLPVEAVEAGLGRLAAARTGPSAVQVLDPVERGLPFQGRVRFEGLEGEGEMLIDRAEASRASYKEVLAAHDAAVAAAFRRHGGAFVRHGTDAKTMQGLLDFLPHSWSTAEA
ncbi:MAG: DUF58 domain-containing protein [Geminicoccaceae bacterium]|nr:DUF58 domain-containing protein [Geminicoccaceae bacterium]